MISDELARLIREGYNALGELEFTVSSNGYLLYHWADRNSLSDCPGLPLARGRPTDRKIRCLWRLPSTEGSAEFAQEMDPRIGKHQRPEKSARLLLSRSDRHLAGVPGRKGSAGLPPANAQPANRDVSCRAKTCL